MRIQCNLCEAAVAKVLCCADEAALCLECDEKVHAANKLVSEHQRLPLFSSSSFQMPKCDICQVRTSEFFLKIELKGKINLSCNVDRIDPFFYLDRKYLGFSFVCKTGHYYVENVMLLYIQWIQLCHVIRGFCLLGLKLMLEPKLTPLVPLVSMLSDLSIYTKCWKWNLIKLENIQ